MLKIFYGKQKTMQLFKGCLTVLSLFEIGILILLLPHEGSSSWEANGSSATGEKFAAFSNRPCKFISMFTTARPGNGFQILKGENVRQHVSRNSRALAVLMNWLYI